MRKTVVINAVGLTPKLIGTATPRLSQFRDAGKLATIAPVLPAVTTTVQATYLTGTWPSEHGVVANGWYFRDECEVKFWKQAGALVQRPRVWDLARQRDPKFTCANLFWWYAMYCGADVTVTPRPMYPADGRKLPDVWTHPPRLRDDLQRKLGQFPLFRFWGPATSIEATRWIADAAIHVDIAHDPTLTLIYLPHLDYGLQKYGPDDPRIQMDLAELDGVIGKLLDYYQPRDAAIMILSEYGIASVGKPIHLNRILRQRGLVAIREEMGRELLDTGASAAFAVADHQVAHVYVNDRNRMNEVRQILEGVDGIDRVLDDAGKRDAQLDNPRSGELVAIASPAAWFTYYYWLDDARAPDFARTVDIHRKPGYDPAELFINPRLAAPKLKIAATLLKKKLGFRTLLNVIPLDATMVRGSHGREPATPDDGALVISSEPKLLPDPSIPPVDVCRLILDHLG